MGIFKSLIGTVLLTLLVTVIILINISIFLIYSPDPSTEHYLHVKNVNLTAAAASNTTDGSNNHKSATRTKKPISPKLVPSENSTVQYFHLPHSLDAAIAYEISGPENGYPVFMMHDLPGSKNWVHINESQLLELHGIKLIRFDRLGLGHSAADRALLNKLQLSQESSGKKLAPKKQRNKQQQARQVQQKQQQKLHTWETFMEWFNSFLNNDKAKQVKFTVANSVESEFIPLVNHVLKDNSQHFSIVGYGMGAPFALAALRSKQWNVSRIDSVSLLAPLGQPTSTQDKNVDDWEEGCYLYQQIHKWANHPEHQYRAELAIRALWSAASKFGLVTHHEAWPKLFRPCMNTDDVQLLFSNTTVSDQWLNVFNRTMIDLYMQGTSTHMNQLIALMRPNGWGFDPSEISTTTSKLQFLYSDVDRFAPAALVERLYNSVCSKSSNSCTKQLTSGVGHFALFNQAFNETLSFLARNPQFSSARNSPTTKIDPINTTSKEEARKEETTSDKMMKKFSSTFLTKASPSPTKRIIVVGTGLAGFSAAIEAVHYAKNHKNQLVKVLMLDKEERIGGNSAKASSGMNALSNDDDAQQFYNDVIKSGGGLSNETLVHILVDQSHDALEFLTRVAHIDMSVVTQCGGHSHQRTFRNYVDPNDPRPKNVGFEIISKMNQLVTGDEDEDLKKSIEIVNGANVVGFLTNEDNNSDNPTVVGVKVQIKESEEVEQLYAESVILATGGYGQDRRDLLHKFAPDWMQEFPSTNGAFSTGDMIKLVHEQLKGQMIHMDQIQVHPTGFINPKDPNSKTVFLAAEALRAYGGILINQQGSRFTNELGTRDRVTNDILANCTNQGIDYKWAFLVINQYVVDHFGKNLMQFYISKGFFTKHDNAADFASTYQLNPATVQTTLDEYNSHVNNKTPDQFGKTLFPTTVDPNETLYVAKITPSIHYTMGGLKFDANARVLNERDQPIPGLYAAGEVTGSLHGRNRLAGNSLLETVVFGRISGRAAVEIDA